MGYNKIYFGVVNQIIQISVYHSPGLIIIYHITSTCPLQTRGVIELLQIAESIGYAAAMHPM